MSVPVTEVVTLRAGESQLRVCPGIGGAIADFTWRGRPILRPSPADAVEQGQVLRLASYPLVPYSNRIGHGELVFQGETFRLQPPFTPEPHVIHGVGWRRAWSVLDQSPDTLTLGLEHAGDEEWPFRFAARQTFRLGDDRLEALLQLMNHDARPMPAGLGFHPFFPLSPNVKLAAAWAGAWVNGADKLPVKWEPLPSDADFRASRPIGDWSVDRCFTGWERSAQLDYGTHRVTVTGSAILGNLVCYIPRGHDFIALEPVSNVNDAFALAARGVPDTGLRVLAPGESIEGTMTIAMDARA